MSHTGEQVASRAEQTEKMAPADMPIGDLVGRLSDDAVRLVRDEIRLAQAEMTQKAKAGGIGVGFFGGAGVFAVYGVAPSSPRLSSACPWSWRCGQQPSSWRLPCSSWLPLLPSRERRKSGRRHPRCRSKLCRAPNRMSTRSSEVCGHERQ